MNKPVWSQLGDAIVFTWPEDGYEIAVDQLHEESAGLHAEISIRTSMQIEDGKKGHIHWARLNLSSTQTRGALAKYLHGRVNTVDWHGMLEYACVVTAREFRKGEPTIVLAKVPEVKQVRWLIDRLLPLEQSSVIYGRGGGAKGWLALAISLAVATGRPFAGLRPTMTGPVLYLDWEADDIETRRRLGWLCRGLDMEVPSTIEYRHMTRPIAAEGRRIREEIARMKAVLVIVDSLVPATNDDPRDASPARLVMETLRTFRTCTRLAIAHLTKADSRNSSGEATVFGSIFYENLGRSLWEFRTADQSAKSTDIGLYHRKTNQGPLQEPFGFRATWDDEQYLATLSTTNVENVAGLAAHATLAWRITQALKRGALTTSQLAEVLSLEEDAVRSECNRMSSVVNTNAKRGRGAEALWGLKAREDAKA